ncbi:hypothetical protein EXS73_02095 [Candidatus Pacearchaeota archaeon]|nr:hypothetical protein [Candidatus Pacearchaeota archaeon]
MNITYALLKKITIGIMGITLLLIGFILLFIPGPGIPIIIGGLILLSSEFLWARHMVIKHKLRKPEAFIKQEEIIIAKEITQEEKKIINKIKKEF